MFQGNAFQGDAFQDGKAGADANQAGYKSLLSFWSGGSALSANQVGFRGLLAFWSGGAGAGAGATVTTGLHGRPPRRRGRRRLDREWCEALELAAAIREQLEEPQPPPPQEVEELSVLARDLVEIVRDSSVTIRDMARELSSLMKDVAQRKAQIKAAELAAAIEAEIDEEEACLLLLS